MIFCYRHLKIDETEDRFFPVAFLSPSIQTITKRGSKIIACVNMKPQYKVVIRMVSWIV